MSYAQNVVEREVTITWDGYHTFSSVMQPIMLVLNLRGVTANLKSCGGQCS